MQVHENNHNTIDTVMARLQAGHKGADMPRLMAAFGVNYDAACDAVFSDKFESAIALLETARAIPRGQLYMAGDAASVSKNTYDIGPSTSISAIAGRMTDGDIIVTKDRAGKILRVHRFTDKERFQPIPAGTYPYPHATN